MNVDQFEPKYSFSELCAHMHRLHNMEARFVLEANLFYLAAMASDPNVQMSVAARKEYLSAIPDHIAAGLTDAMFAAENYMADLPMQLSAIVAEMAMSNVLDTARATENWGKIVTFLTTPDPLTQLTAGHC